MLQKSSTKGQSQTLEMQKVKVGESVDYVMSQGVDYMLKSQSPESQNRILKMQKVKVRIDVDYIGESIDLYSSIRKRKFKFVLI